MSFKYELEREDGSPADPPTFTSAIPTWRVGDMVQLPGRRLRVVAVREPADPNGDPVLVVAAH